MSYESPQYTKLERRTAIVKIIHDHVNAARQYRTMGYGGDVKIVGSDSDGCPIERRLGEEAKTALLAFMAQHHEDIAFNIEATQIPTDIDVRAASKSI